MGKIFEICCLLTVVWSVEGCAAANKGYSSQDSEHLTVTQGLQARATASTNLRDANTEAKVSVLTEDLVYQILLGEISAQRGELGVAVDAYKKATKLSNDAQVAKRATKMAMYEGNVSALDVAKQWAELDPNSMAAQKTVAFLYFRIKDYDQSLMHMKKLLELSQKKDVDGYLFIANLLSQVKEQKAAIALMIRLVDETQSNYKGDFALAKLALISKNHALAKARVQRVLAIKPQYSPAQIVYGRILISAGDKVAALAYFKKIYQAGEADFAMKNTYARLLVDAKQYAAAKQVFLRMLADDPKNNDTIYALALLAMQTESFDSAEQYLQVLEKGKFKQDEIQFYLGQLADEQKDTKKAFRWYRKIGQGKYYFDAQLRMIDLLALTGKMTESRDLVQKLRALFPKLSVKLYLLEAEVLEREKMYQVQMQLYDQALQEHPGNEDVLYNRALLGEKIGRLDILERDLRLVIAQNPENANALNALGYTLTEQTDRYREALPLIEKALALKPNDAAVMDSMGWVRYKLGELKASESYLRKAYETLADGEIAAHLSEVLYQQGLIAEAKQIWSKAMEKEPENPHLLSIKDYFNE